MYTGIILRHSVLRAIDRMAFSPEKMSQTKKEKKRRKKRKKGEGRYFRIIDVAFYLVLLSVCPWCSFRFGGRDGIPSGCNSYGNYELTRALGHARAAEGTRVALNWSRGGFAEIAGGERDT